MKRPTRFAAIASSLFVLVLLMLAATGIFVARSGWLREAVRERIVSEAERATGGRVETGAFTFDWSTLTAELDRLTIHGTETAGQSPLLTVDRVAIGLKVVSLMEGKFNIARLEAETPRVHLIFQPDGTTNIPQPKTRHRGKPGAETILDLRIGVFNLANGAMSQNRPAESPL